MPVLRGRQGTSLPRTVHAAHICIAFVSIFVLFLAQPAEPLRLPGADDIRRWLRRGTAETASDSAWGAEVFGRPLLSQRSEVDPVAQRILASGAYGGSGSNGRANADALSTVFDAAALDQLQGQALSDARRTAPDAATTAAAYTSAASSGAFDLERASMLATLQSIAYCGDQDGMRAWSCRRCARVPGFQPAVVHFDADWDLLGYAGYLPSLNAKVVAFRGSDAGSWANWANNMRAWRTDAAYPLPGAPSSLRIHSGFHVLWNSSSMARTFTAAYAGLLAAHPNGPTYVLGHSMGGALAQLCAMDLRVAFDPPDLRVFTFGSPRVGNGEFAAFFVRHVAESWRFTHGRDIVPSVPPTYMGFRHVAREVWLVDVAPAAGGAEPEQRVIVCDESGEDPSCHNSVCHLGMCTSVADHLTYMGAHMWAGDEC
ncbi:Lipase [Monoraphidium neglectum]|uniref:Lipase n=1 Tax=Monoraphidium neglectum TaxID=145388 RepID=A0A0D2N0W8_9CHLO|nr:Lipase [Monoraphidium neglectum]KIZ06147.1 Lipase [Monoraphidium neglectum]|eukprot:XP_013905166.1 Lipase [Monoraphidium neglectum]